MWRVYFFFFLHDFFLTGFNGVVDLGMGKWLLDLISSWAGVFWVLVFLVLGLIK